MSRFWILAGIAEVVAVAAAVTQTLAAFALDSEDLVQAIRQGKIWQEDVPVDVDHTAKGEVTVTTVRNPKATDDDCKIDAILVAKQLMEADAQDVKRVKVDFFANDDSYDETRDQVVVNAGDIKAYAAQSISQSDLLASLELDRMGAPGVMASLSLKTAEAKQLEALGELISLARILQDTQGTGIDVGPMCHVVDDVVVLISNKESDAARSRMGQLRHRVEVIKGSLKRADTLRTDPVLQLDWKPLFQFAGKKLQEILGPQTPPVGVFRSQLCRIRAKIYDLEAEGVDVKETLAKYKALIDMPWTNQNAVRAPMFKLVAELAHTRQPEIKPQPKESRESD